MKKICTICCVEKDTNNGDFQTRKTPNGTVYFRTECRSCRIEYSKKYYSNNKNKIIKQNTTNKKNNRERVNYRERERKNKNIGYKISCNIRSLIKITFKRNLRDKNKESSLKYLPYSIQELKNHLEYKFEPWGVYNSDIWNDEDSSTWTWQIDHIIPQSNLPYTSLSDNNFVKCWSLSNLRPYSAKQNIIDGASRIRHKAV